MLKVSDEISFLFCCGIGTKYLIFFRFWICAQPNYIFIRFICTLLLLIFLTDKIKKSVKVKAEAYCCIANGTIIERSLP